jgi:hypothetical protein
MTILIQFLSALRFHPGAARSLTPLLTSIALTVVIGETEELSKVSGPAETSPPKAPWGRIVMVGASATAGFTESEPLGGSATSHYRLSRYVDAALFAPHEPVRNLATSMFFMQADAIGRAQIEQALKSNPTLVIGIDFLFWFCYGDGPTDKDRLQRFENGLKLLEAVRCPLVVGDIPDASGASDSVLAPEQIPSAAAMLAANRRLKEWASARPRVVVVSLSSFMRAATANQALTVRGYTLDKGKTSTLLQSDRLHPSSPGCAVLALAILDAFQSTRPISTANEVQWNPREVYRRVSTPANSSKETSPEAPAGK